MMRRGGERGGPVWGTAPGWRLVDASADYRFARVCAICTFIIVQVDRPLGRQGVVRHMRRRAATVGSSAAVLPHMDGRIAVPLYGFGAMTSFFLSPPMAMSPWSDQPASGACAPANGAGLAVCTSKASLMGTLVPGREGQPHTACLRHEAGKV